MKKSILLLVTLLLIVGIGALAEEQYAVPENTAMDMDLDGDGQKESVSWETVHVDEYTDDYVVTVVREGEQALTYKLEGGYLLGVYAVDLDDDGRTELFLTGDEASDDYITICLHLFKGRLEPAMFADCTRTDYNHGYDKFGYGKITGIDGNHLTLSGSQDILGTWFGTRVFTLADTGVFEFADDGRWVREGLTPETWEYQSLTTIAELPYVTPEGKDATLPVGTRLIIVASDKRTAEFETKDGLKGIISIYPNFQGWGSTIDNKPEEHYFEYVPYAD